MKKFAYLFKSWTIWGAVGGSLTWLSQQPHVGPVEVIQSVAAVMTAIGLRRAVQNSGPSKE